ncbi:tetratricopeptide repeat protein [Proteobacteria bacterium 005FR1]|nr:tetratricopeptide repeat protein [Proteobacteria bacterium 005FR1]
MNIGSTFPRLIATGVALAFIGCIQVPNDAQAQPSQAQAEACAQQKAVLVPQTGDYSRAIPTDSPEAQAFFDQGLRLTYSYYFPEALASFDAALCFDADNPMIHWGRALAIAPNPNSRYGGAPDDPAGLGREAIVRAQQNAEKLPALERGLIDTLAVLFAMDEYSDQDARSRAFIEASRKLASEYPDDLEAAFLAAGAIMMASPWQYFSQTDGSPIGYAGEAMRLLEEGMEKDPQHPGLNHLHIHLMENSREPERAEVSADRLESLTPRAGHMVHMPGHIYMRIGRFEDAIATNERSLAADQYFVQQWGDRPLPTGLTYGLSARVHGGHALNFIQWGSLLQGNSERAIKVAKDMAGAVSQERLDQGLSLRTPAVYYMTLRAFGRWDEILKQVLPSEQQPYLAGLLHSVRGSALLAKGDVERARKELALLQAAAKNPRLADQFASVNRAGDLLAIAEDLLEGEIASATGKHDKAIQHFRSAVQGQDQLRYMEPPDWMQSTRLFLGQAYLDAGAFKEAERTFREDLQSIYENGWALYGLIESLEGQGEVEEAASIKARFDDAWSNADVKLQAAHF